jgi:Uma2 family endonuclease
MAQLTPPPVTPPTSLASLAALGARRFTVADYHKMHDAGILMDGERVELLDGYVVEKPLRKPPHEGAVRRLTIRLPRHVPPGWSVQIQDAITLPSDSEPEPDAAVIRGDETAYDTRHPGPADVGIVIEVSGSSLAFDRGEKSRLYARDGIPAYWIVNVADRQIEVYADPQPTASPPAYATHTDYRPGDSVPLVLDGVAVASIPVADLIP